jgi:formamidopyrimidine-DNA glycosylase
LSRSSRRCHRRFVSPSLADFATQPARCAYRFNHARVRGMVPEIPDIDIYVEALRARIVGLRMLGIRLVNPFFLRSFDPPLTVVNGARVLRVFRLGKRIVLELAVSPESLPEGEVQDGATCFLVIHLMIAGRLHWVAARAGRARGTVLAGLDFEAGTLLVTEAGTKRRAWLRLAQGEAALAALDAGGLEVQPATAEEFRAALRRENHTLKRALTDPRIVSGIGNAYSDEILHRARLSPFKKTDGLTDSELHTLHEAAIEVLGEWTERLRAEAGEDFPEKVTAFRPEMAVHGRFGLPCPVCGTKVMRIAYADNECDYCPRCQTDGRILADRSLSRLLKDDWPRTVDDMDAPSGKA